ncbi:peptidase M56 BlaR1 [Sutcliffiella sp. NPDC057660]|uniref:peptidase M56 BlaR1 n=1 Tax=Sutcliffiella sp. NPDC057660 TaxID=3346199 RepID=UPI0036862A87
MLKGVLTLGIIISFGVAVSFGITTKSNNNVIISTSEIGSNHPKNKHGLTYGSSADTLTYGKEPDLIKAYGIDGTMGYVKKEDLHSPMPKTPEEALKLTKEAKDIEIPLYDNNGETVIGTFLLGSGSSE